jgi:integrase
MRRTTTTAPIKWTQAQTIIKGLMHDRKHNTALLFASGFYFGLRIGDILRLTWEQITGEQLTITEQKTGKVRSITMHKDYQRLVNDILSEKRRKPSGFVFVHQRADGRKDKPISITAANKRIKRAFQEYGIQTANPSSHTLRKTFGRRVYENNSQSEAALILLSQIFNHRDVSTTRRYIGLTREKIENAYLSL